MYGAGPGRWSGRGPQLQNLKKNEGNIPLAAVDAVRDGDRDQLRQYGNPLTVLGDIARATVCAAPGNVLMAADFGAIESQSPGLARGETWKLETYREFDRTNDKTIEPYRVVAAKMLHKNDPAGLTKEERNKGKAGDLACGFGGSVGAWRRIASDDQRSDEEIHADVRAWREAHPKTIAYWRELARAIRIAIRTGQPFAAGKIVASFEDGNLYLTLPSGRQITYPQARLVAEQQVRGRRRQTCCSRTMRAGKWTDYRGWFGTFVENVVQGTARDLLAAAIERFEARGIPVVLTVHDEVVAEVPTGIDHGSGLPRHPARAAGMGRRSTARRQGLERHALPRATRGTSTGIRQSDGSRRLRARRRDEPDKLIDAAIDGHSAPRGQSWQQGRRGRRPRRRRRPAVRPGERPAHRRPQDPLPVPSRRRYAVAAILRRPLPLLRLWRSWRPDRLAHPRRRH